MTANWKVLQQWALLGQILKPEQLYITWTYYIIAILLFLISILRLHRIKSL